MFGFTIFLHVSLLSLCISLTICCAVRGETEEEKREERKEKKREMEEGAGGCCVVTEKQGREEKEREKRKKKKGAACVREKRRKKRKRKEEKGKWGQVACVSDSACSILIQMPWLTNTWQYKHTPFKKTLIFSKLYYYPHLI
jgi:hypothetical protein